MVRHSGLRRTPTNEGKTGLILSSGNGSRQLSAKSGILKGKKKNQRMGTKKTEVPSLLFLWVDTFGPPWTSGFSWVLADLTVEFKNDTLKAKERETHVEWNHSYQLP